ncbi:MAG: DUF819 family protein [Clostridia bacterium]|nr:DUF819 family protein [Clostridia bacterium]
MNIALTVIAILAILLLPVLMVFLTRKSKILGAVGAIALCYILGFIFSTIGFSPVCYDKELTSTIAYVLVALSIPLVLFSIDLRSVKTLAKSTVIGYVLCIVSALIVAVVMFFISRLFMQGTDILSAMTIGLYTGGTPNLVAIGGALGADDSVINAANVSDSLVGGIYFLLMISVAPKAYSFLLGKGKQPALAVIGTVEPEQMPKEEKKVDDYTFGFSIKDKKSVFKLVGAFFLAVGCLGVGALLEFLIKGTVGNDLLYILLSVSILGVAFSFIKPVREIKGQYTFGMYLILMFSLALAMSIDWSVFLTNILPTLAFFAIAQISVILIHALLCKIFRIDGYTAVITSTAGVYGPPFIAPVAKAANRPDMIAPGVICGAVGLAIGTFIGCGMGFLFRLV